MNGKVKIRADGRSQVGLGHIVRCISLAHMLKNDFEIYFYSENIPYNLSKDIKKEGWELISIKSEKEFISSLNSKEIVVLDGYRFDSEYQKKIKENGSALVCIDDFHDQHIYADLVINHAPGVNQGDYDGEPYTKYLLGLDYALLRPEFLKLIDEDLIGISDELENILICFGGSDSKNFTCKILSQIPQNSYDVNVVVGSSYRYMDELNKLAGASTVNNVYVKSSLSGEQMKVEMLNADLAIVPSSGILLEVISMRTPVISGYVVNNQESMYEGIKETNSIVPAANFDETSFDEAFEEALVISKREKLIEAQKKVFDKKSNERITYSFKSLFYKYNLKVRLATHKDIHQYYEWANDPAVRKNAFNPEKIKWENHVDWFANKLSSESSILFVFELDDIPVGQVRFDHEKNEGWYIDYSLDKDYRGYGLGKLLIEMGTKELTKKCIKEIQVIGLVKDLNEASKYVFRKLDYSEKVTDNNIYKFTKSVSL